MRHKKHIDKVFNYFDTCWLHYKHRNCGCRPQRFGHYTIAAGLTDSLVTAVAVGRVSITVSGLFCFLIAKNVK